MKLSRIANGVVWICAILASANTHADLLDAYRFTGAGFNDGSSMHGTFTIDWTHGVQDAVRIDHSAATKAASTGGPSAASRFDVVKNDALWQIGSLSIVNQPDIREIRIPDSTTPYEFLYLDFYRNTGLLYMEHLFDGTHLNLHDSNVNGTDHVSLYDTETGPVSAAPRFKTIDLLLLGVGLIGIRTLQRKRRVG